MSYFLFIVKFLFLSRFSFCIYHFVYRNLICVYVMWMSVYSIHYLFYLNLFVCFFILCLNVCLNRKKCVSAHESIMENTLLDLGSISLLRGKNSIAYSQSLQQYISHHFTFQVCRTFLFRFLDNK